MALRVSDFLPGKFSGNKDQDPKSHFLSFHDYLQIHDIANDDMDQILARFKNTLAGQARIWIEGKVFADLDTLKKTFLRYFSGLHSREASARHFRSIRFLPGQSMDQYASTIRSAAETLGYNDDLVRDQFLQGLPKQLQLQLSMAAQQNLDHLIGLAQKYVDLTTTTGPVSFDDTQAFGTFGDDRIKTMSDAITKLTEQVQNLAKPDTFEKTENRPSRTCGRSPGQRVSRNSQSPRRSSKSPAVTPDRSTDRHRNRNQNKPQCSYCKKFNHTWRDCRKLARDMSSRSRDFQ